MATNQDADGLLGEMAWQWDRDETKPVPMERFARAINALMMLYHLDAHEVAADTGIDAHNIILIVNRAMPLSALTFQMLHELARGLRVQSQYLAQAGGFDMYKLSGYGYPATD